MGEKSIERILELYAFRIQETMSKEPDKENYYVSSVKSLAQKIRETKSLIIKITPDLSALMSEFYSVIELEENPFKEGVYFWEIYRTQKGIIELALMNKLFYYFGDEAPESESRMKHPELLRPLYKKIQEISEILTKAQG